MAIHEFGTYPGPNATRAQDERCSVLSCDRPRAAKRPFCESHHERFMDRAFAATRTLGRGSYDPDIDDAQGEGWR